MREFLLNYWIEFVFGSSITFLGMLYRNISKKYKKHDEEHESIKIGLTAILWDKLYNIWECGKYQNGITIYQMKNAESVYQAYKKLGANGTGSELYKRISQLTIIEGD